ncbi:hypothetical protein SDC9_05977 [bioreactor metagenome]|uniref:Uncharacterized protein n=1 Tax=bioreactor metagenome TaxID=1076179 RepID=A0A644T0L7_9ZZZZ
MVQHDTPCIELISSNNQKQVVPLNDVIEIHMGATGKDMGAQFDKVKDAKAMIDPTPFEVCLIKQAKNIPNYQEYRQERQLGK